MNSNGKPNVPLLFKEIMRNDTERAELKAQSVIPFDKASWLRREHRDQMRAAEQMLHWNADKGDKQK